MTSPAAHTLIRRIQFADTDAAGVAHFSRLLVMVEEAEHDFLRSHQIPILTETSAWPCVSLEVSYVGMCKFGYDITIELRILKVGTSSVTYEFLATLNGSPQASPVFSGKMVKCHILPRQLGAVPIPESIRDVLARFLSQET